MRLVRPLLLALVAATIVVTAVDVFQTMTNLATTSFERIQRSLKGAPFTELHETWLGEAEALKGAPFKDYKALYIGDSVHIDAELERRLETKFNCLASRANEVRALLEKAESPFYDNWPATAKTLFFLEIRRLVQAAENANHAYNLDSIAEMAYLATVSWINTIAWSSVERFALAHRLPHLARTLRGRLIDEELHYDLIHRAAILATSSAESRGAQLDRLFTQPLSEGTEQQQLVTVLDRFANIYRQLLIEKRSYAGDVAPELPAEMLDRWIASNVNVAKRSNKFNDLTGYLERIRKDLAQGSGPSSAGSSRASRGKAVAAPSRLQLPPAPPLIHAAQPADQQELDLFPIRPSSTLSAPFDPFAYVASPRSTDEPRSHGAPSSSRPTAGRGGGRTVSPDLGSLLSLAPPMSMSPPRRSPRLQGLSPEVGGLAPPSDMGHSLSLAPPSFSPRRSLRLQGTDPAPDRVQGYGYGPDGSSSRSSNLRPVENEATPSRPRERTGVARFRRSKQQQQQQPDDEI